MLLLFYECGNHIVAYILWSKGNDCSRKDIWDI